MWGLLVSLEESKAPVSGVLFIHNYYCCNVLSTQLLEEPIFSLLS